MKAIIVGFGVQGIKRLKVLGKKCVATVDKFNSKADYKSIKEVDLKEFDTVFICVPESEKYSIIKYCLKKNKNFFIEKPLYLPTKNINLINKKLKLNKKKGYVAFNHRFEPNIIKLRSLIAQKKIGKIYSCKIFYGNGTSRLVKNSWRDKKKGIHIDLGSHIIDIAIYLFGFKNMGNLHKVFENKYENNYSDHILFCNKNSKIKMSFEATYCSWRNKFYIEIIGKKGSFYLDNLCKWRSSTLYIMKRTFPSGKPSIEKIKFSKGDKTWVEEQRFFEKINQNKINKDFLSNIFLNKKLSEIL